MCVVVAPARWVVEGPVSDVYLFGETVGVGPDDAGSSSRCGRRSETHGSCGAKSLTWTISFEARTSASTECRSNRSASLGTDELERLRGAAQALALDPSTLEGLRPWLAGQVLRTRTGPQLPTLAFFGAMTTVVEMEYLARGHAARRLM